ncbi:hypothetical protein J6590_028819 [Homalodisca vitripennis]|nr:hypothetical protein J6590_028819 [Homalodisca vitripennis]
MSYILELLYRTSAKPVTRQAAVLTTVLCFTSPTPFEGVSSLAETRSKGLQLAPGLNSVIKMTESGLPVPHATLGDPTPKLEIHPSIPSTCD